MKRRQRDNTRKNTTLLWFVGECESVLFLSSTLDSHMPQSLPSVTTVIVLPSGRGISIMSSVLSNLSSACCHPKERVRIALASIRIQTGTQPCGCPVQTTACLRASGLAQLPNPSLVGRRRKKKRTPQSLQELSNSSRGQPPDGSLVSEPYSSPVTIIMPRALMYRPCTSRRWSSGISKERRGKHGARGLSNLHLYFFGSYWTYLLLRQSPTGSSIVDVSEIFVPSYAPHTSPQKHTRRPGH